MSIADNYLPTKQVGDGVTVDFTASWNVFNEDYLQVIFEDVVTGVQTTQTTGFTVAFTSSLVTATFAVAPTNAVYVILARSIPFVQQVPYKTSRGFQGLSIETSLDLVTAMVQDLKDDIDRSPKTPVGSDPLSFPTYSTGKVLGWSSSTAGVVVNSANTIAEMEGAISAVGALTAQSGVKVTSADTTVGFLDGKLVAGNALTFTVNDPAADESLTIAPDIASQAEAEAGTVTDKLMNPLRTAEAIAALGTSGTAHLGKLEITTPLTSVDIGSGLDLDAVIDGSYQYYAVRFQLIPSTDSSNLSIRIGESTGFPSVNYGYCNIYTQYDTSAGTPGDGGSSTAAPSLATDIGNGANEGVHNGYLVLGNASDSSLFSYVNGTCETVNSSAIAEHWSFGGRTQQAALNDRLRFQMSSGNIASGRFDLFGIGEN